MRRFLNLALLTGLVFVARSASAADVDPKTAKEALQALNDFVGSWNGDGKLNAKTSLDPSARRFRSAQTEGLSPIR
jgi:hypothetical protein